MGAENGSMNTTDENISNQIVQSPKPKKKWWFILAVAIVLLAAGSAGAWYYSENRDKNTEAETASTLATTSPSTSSEDTSTNATTDTTPDTAVTTDETAGWQVYANSNVGLSFKYPTTWKATEDTKGIIYLINTEKTYQYEGGALEPIVIQYVQDISGASIENYLTGARANLKTVQKESTAIDGQTAYVLDGIVSPAHIEQRIVFLNGYVITFTNHQKNIQAADSTSDPNNEITSVYNKLLNTVQFSDPTAGWKTYTNTTHKFSFKYPDDWLVKDMTEANRTHIDGMVGFYGSNPKTIGEDSFFMVEVNTKTVADLVATQKNNIANNPNDELVSETNITRYGQNGTELRTRNKTTNVIYTQQYFSVNSLSYVVTGDSTDTDAIYRVVNRIDDTFQFTK